MTLATFNCTCKVLSTTSTLTSPSCPFLHPVHKASQNKTRMTYVLCTNTRIVGKDHTFSFSAKCPHSDVLLDDYFSVRTDGIDQEGIEKLE